MSKVLLAIETATSACSVALCRDQRTINRSQVGTNIHSQVVLEMIAELFAELEVNAKSLSAVAVGQGPGSFTGLRIGIGVAQGIAYGGGCPMIGVSSLAALAWQAKQTVPETDAVLAGIDARMGEIYCAEYSVESEFPEAICEIQVLAPELVATDKHNITLAGNAWHEYQQQLSAPLQEYELPEPSVMLPDATAVLALARKKLEQGETIEPAAFVPDYIRNNVAKKAVKK